MGLGPSPGPAPAWRCLSERRGSEGDPRIRQGRGGRTGGWDAGVRKNRLLEGAGTGWGRKRARTGEEHLGASWGAQMVQVKGWTTAE